MKKKNKIYLQNKIQNKNKNIFRLTTEKIEMYLTFLTGNFLKKKRFIFIVFLI